MIDAALLSRLERILNLESNSFMRYLVTSAELKASGEFDSRVLALYEEWWRETERSRRAIESLLAEESHFPTSGVWPLQYSQYNFLRPAYLLQAVRRFMEEQLDLIAREAEGLQDWPRARQLLTALLERERPYLEQVKRLEAERPREEPKPARVKGTSAARW